ncbi:MAG: DUF2065 domain-containing protein [Siculibacillus sp.]|nr:DUF2065 domain-containing protein [Siculibacillus sp.]
MEGSSGLGDLVVALGLMAALEGALYAAAPGFMKQVLSRAAEVPDTILRRGGLAALVLGVVIVWAVRG